MSNVSNTNQSNQALFSQIESSFKNDNRIDKNELNSLKELISTSDLDPQIKESVTSLLENAKKASDGFLWIFGRDISDSELAGLNQELGKIKELAAASGDNSLAKDLCNVIENALPKASAQPEDNSNVTPRDSAGFNPIANFFNNLFNPKKSEGNATTNNQTPSQARDGICRTDVPSFHLTQYTGAPSEKGDCGPTSGAMILRAFGIDASVQDVRNNAPDKPSGAPWALREDQISSSMKELSGGKVTQSGPTETYSPSDKTEIMDDIKSQLAEGKLLMLCTGVNDADWDSRHYVVITGIDSNGNLQIADPAKPNGSDAYYMTPDELFTRMNNAQNLDDGPRPTTLTAFQRNS